MKLFFQLLPLRLGMGLCYVGLGQEAASRWLSKMILRATTSIRRFSGFDEEEEKQQEEERVAEILAEIDATPPDKYTIDLCAWKGGDGDPILLVEMSADQFAALKYTASAKHVTVQALLGDAVRKAVTS